MPRSVEISVVVPCHRESSGLVDFYRALSAAFVTEAAYWQVVFVDDGSNDDTWQVIEQLGARNSNVVGIRLSRNFGKEAALTAGLERAEGRAIITMDADLQHPPAIIPEMIREWRDGASVVDGVKLNRAGQGALGRGASQAFNRIFHTITGVDLTNATDYKLLDRVAVDGLLRFHERGSFFRGLSSQLGFQRKSVEFEVLERSNGSSKFSSRALIRLGMNALTAFTARPLHIISLMSAAFGVFALVLGVQTLVRFLSGHTVEGFTTLILLVLIVGTCLMAGLGIIGEYLARVHEEVKGRPRYLVWEEVKSDPE